ncbi:MAG: type VI secretion system tube protein Hcp [Candidatus Cohnella colombiensis]|uniref:Type VI secretion system tube protein Hcp n=1 Tax=Candidatus Cohnella colombiensis TaxID=3121368 RepID=A0AA95JFD0_9BACL|nr:MAG: type VI secretion system tube protein Hcp [Cohnella sp.]
MTKVRTYFLVIMIVILLGIGSGTTAIAATITEDSPTSNYNVYLKLDGICGESKAVRYANWIELSGVEFNVSNSFSATASGAGGATGKAEMDQFVISKAYDCSSIPLMMDSLSGKHIKNGQLVFVRPSSDQSIPVLKIDLDNVTIVNYQFSMMNETVSFQVGSIQFSYTAQDDKGGKKLPIQGGWDFIANQMK